MQAYGKTARVKPNTGTGDGTNAIVRVNQLGELYTAPDGLIGSALEAAFYVGSNPTIGTPVAVTAAATAAFTATTPSFLVRNTDAPGGQDIVLQRLRLINAAIGTGGTALDCAVVVDSANRYSTGGTVITPVNALADSANTLPGLVYLTPTASAAGGTARTLGRAKLKAAALVAGDVFTLGFGAQPAPETGSLAGTTAALYAMTMPPVIVRPGGSALIYLWSAGQTAAPTYEYQLELSAQ